MIISRGAFVGLMAAPAIHGIIGDELWFYSDAYSLAVYCGAWSFLGALVAVALLPISAWTPSRVRKIIYRLTGLVLLAALLAGSLRLVMGIWRHDQYISWLTIACVMIALPVAVVFSYSAAIQQRLDRLAVVVGVYALVLWPGLVAYNHWANQPARNVQHKHLVFLVLDGFPAQFLHTYNPHEERTSLDRLLDEALVFDNVYTEFPYTYGYFGQLYSGLDTTYFDADLGMMRVRYALPVRCLLGKLQQEGVAVRWICWHRNGYPESSAAYARDYLGLRSYFLSPRWVRIPRALGLDYHIALPSGTVTARCVKGRLGKSVYQWLHPSANGMTAWSLASLVASEQQQLRSRSARSFVLVHIRWTDISMVSETLTAAFDDAPAAADALSLQTIHKNAYRYSRDQEPFVARERHRARHATSGVGDGIVAVLQNVREQGTQHDASVLITADHGSIYGKGRLWYGYHPNKEVTNVLCAYFGGGRRGRDRRLFSSQDLHATVLDFFGIRCPQGALSLLASGPGRDKACVLTRSSTTEWWFVVVTTDVTYWCNLSPGGKGEFYVFATNSYDEMQLARHDGAGEDQIPADVVNILKESLERYALQPDVIHPRFRAILHP